MRKRPRPPIKIDVEEADDRYTVKADMPGVAKEDIRVDVDGNMVSIAAEVRRETKEEKEGKVLRSERYFGHDDAGVHAAGGSGCRESRGEVCRRRPDAHAPEAQGRADAPARDPLSGRNCLRTRAPCGALFSAL